MFAKRPFQWVHTIALSPMCSNLFNFSSYRRVRFFSRTSNTVVTFSGWGSLPQICFPEEGFLGQKLRMFVKAFKMMLKMLNLFPKALGQLTVKVSYPFLIVTVKPWSQLLPHKRNTRSSVVLEIRRVAVLRGIVTRRGHEGWSRGW